VEPHFSPGRAQVRLGATHAWYGEPVELLEGYARPLWGLAPLAAGGGAFSHWDLWRAGLAAGTDPDHVEFWGWPCDFDQRIVEMAPIALGLLLAPGELWDPLPAAVRTRVTAWLGRVNAVRPVDSNWRFFRVLVNLALRQCREECSEENLEADLTRLDAFHLGGGWYADGAPGPSLRDGRVGDYYGPMGMQFCALLYARLARKADAGRAAVYAVRARQFAGDFIHWFAADGAALPFGRSLTYRFAQGAFWGALAFADIEAWPWPVIKGLYMRHLRWWMRQPIFSDSGLLTIGYAYPNLVMAESYNGPASPYWALKALLPLALPEDHPFWLAEEAPLPPRPSIHTVPAAKLVVMGSAGAGEVVALSPGQPVRDWPRHAAQKYSKFAYSTRFGFSVPVGAATPQEGGFDSMLALSEDQIRFRERDLCLEPAVADGVAYSRWHPWPDVEVRTWLVAADSGHVRIHCIDAGRRLWSVETGFASGYARVDLVGARAADNAAEVTTPSGWSSLRNLWGERSGEVIHLGANSNLLFSLAAMPALRAAHEPGRFWLVCLVSARPPALDQGRESREGGIAVQFSGGNCMLLRDGALWWETKGGVCGSSAPARRRMLEGATSRHETSL